MNNNDLFENQGQGVLYVSGTRGYSAYEVAVQNGFEGTEQEWLDSLIGPQGEPGTPFDELTEEQKAEIRGEEGKSAYEIAVENGFIGTEQDWVNSFLTPEGYYNKEEIDSVNSIQDEKIEFIYPENIKVHYINSGTNKGDCIVIETNNKNMIIDFGETTDGLPVINYLINNNITKIDYALVTHYHMDHIGGSNAQGLLSIINNTSLDFSNCIFLLPRELDTSKWQGTEITGLNNVRTLIINTLTNKEINYREPVEDEIIELDINTNIRLINCYNEENWDIYYANTYHANGGFYTSNGVEDSNTELNNFSIVCELKHGTHTFLFTSDIEPIAQEQIVDKISMCDVYKIEHHGANDTTNNYYLEKIKPKVAINMNREGTNYFNRTLSYLRSLGIPIYTTNDSGNIVVQSDKYNLVVSAENNSFYDEIGLDRFCEGLNIIGYNNNYTPLVTKNQIKENDDLNDYIIPGTYRCANNSINITITNKPTLLNYRGGFILDVRQLSNPNIIEQTIYSTAEENYIFHRIRRIISDDGQGNVELQWTKWVSIGNEYIYLGEWINENDDLNDYLTPGVYRTQWSGITNSLTNCPLTGTSFKMEVEYLSGTDMLRQTIKVHNATSDTYIRTRFGNDSIGYEWQSWYKVNVTVVS